MTKKKIATATNPPVNKPVPKTPVKPATKIEPKAPAKPPEPKPKVEPVSKVPVATKAPAAKPLPDVFALAQSCWEIYKELTPDGKREMLETYPMAAGIVWGYGAGMCIPRSAMALALEGFRKVLAKEVEAKCENPAEHLGIQSMVAPKPWEPLPEHCQTVIDGTDPNITVACWIANGMKWEYVHGWAEPRQVLEPTEPGSPPVEESPVDLAITDEGGRDRDVVDGSGPSVQEQLAAVPCVPTTMQRYADKAVEYLDKQITEVSENVNTISQDVTEQRVTPATDSVEPDDLFDLDGNADYEPTRAEIEAEERALNAEAKQRNSE